MAALVLAAGRGRRFGGAKLLEPLRGRPILEHTLDGVTRARSAGLVADVRVVVGDADAAEARLARDAGCAIVVNAAADTGLSSSLRRGLAALLARSEIGAALVVLADQPLVRVEVIEALVAAWRAGQGTAVRPSYAGEPGVPGHPVLLDRSAWPLAQRLEGDTGLGPVLALLGDRVARVEVPGRNPDVDTPADLATLEGSSS